MINKYFGVLYRNGPAGSANTSYMWTFGHIFTSEELRELRAKLVKRYENLSIEQVDTIATEVDRHNKHKGSQKTLLEKIRGIVGQN